MEAEARSRTHGRVRDYTRLFDNCDEDDDDDEEDHHHDRHHHQHACDDEDDDDGDADNDDDDHHHDDCLIGFSWCLVGKCGMLTTSQVADDDDDDDDDDYECPLPIGALLCRALKYTYAF